MRFSTLFRAVVPFVQRERTRTAMVLSWTLSCSCDCWDSGEILANVQKKKFNLKFILNSHIASRKTVVKGARVKNLIFQTWYALCSRDVSYVDISGLPILSADDGIENECRKISTK